MPDPPDAEMNGSGLLQSSSDVPVHWPIAVWRQQMVTIDWTANCV